MEKIRMQGNVSNAEQSEIEKLEEPINSTNKENTAKPTNNSNKAKKGIEISANQPNLDLYNLNNENGPVQITINNSNGVINMYFQNTNKNETKNNFECTTKSDIGVVCNENNGQVHVTVNESTIAVEAINNPVVDEKEAHIEKQPVNGTLQNTLLHDAKVPAKEHDLIEESNDLCKVEENFQNGLHLENHAENTIEKQNEEVSVADTNQQDNFDSRATIGATEQKSITENELFHGLYISQMSKCKRYTLQSIDLLNTNKSSHNILLNVKALKTKSNSLFVWSNFKSTILTGEADGNGSDTKV